MALRKVQIVNCKSASIRRTPWIPLHAEDIVDIKSSMRNSDSKVPSGTTIEIDTDQICYDWTDRKFYKVKNPHGWIYEGCINLGDGIDERD